MSRRWLAVIGMLAAAGLDAAAYVKIGTEVGGRTVPVRWPTSSVRYFVSDRSAPHVSAVELDAAVSAAFQTWAAVPTSGFGFARVGVTSADPVEGDGMSVLGFQNRPELDRVLGATSFTVDAVTGELLEADVFFNTAFDWSVAPGGEVGRFDLQSIATHEIGHLLGLGHSALGETEIRPEGGRRVVAAGAVMFPIAFSPGNIDDRTLRADDTAGAGDLYPNAVFRAEKGSLSGRVTRDGRGVPGAHVLAFNLTTGELIANFALDEAGHFVIAGLSPGPHLIRVEPIDDADVESFFTDFDVEVDFAVTFSDRVAIVPRGGNLGGVDIEVVDR